MQVTLLPTAREDLREIWLFGAERWGDARADAYFFDLTEAIERLGLAPLMNAVAEELGEPYRRLFFAAHTVIYRVESEAVVVVRVLHQRRHAGVQLL